MIHEDNEEPRMEKMQKGAEGKGSRKAEKREREKKRGRWNGLQTGRKQGEREKKGWNQRGMEIHGMMTKKTKMYF